jgi:hypothetical protein
MNNIEFPIRLNPKNIGLITKFINEKMDIKAKILKQNLSQNRIDELPYKNISTHDRTGYKHAYIKIEDMSIEIGDEIHIVGGKITVKRSLIYK